MIKIFAVTFLFHGDEEIFLKGYTKYFPKVLKKILLKRSTPKYEEYIRYINGIETKLEFFIFPRAEKMTKKILRMYNYILHQRLNNIVFLDKPYHTNIHINCYLTYYILKSIFKKYGSTFKNKKIGVIGIERARKTGFLYEIAEQVEVLYVLGTTQRFERIADELLGEFGTVLVKAYDCEEIINKMDIVFVFENIECQPHKGRIIVCYPEQGIVEDGMFTKRFISLEDVKVDFLPLKEIVVYGKTPFCNLSPTMVGILGEKLLFTSITNFSEAKSVFTKNLFDVKIEFK